MGVRANACVDCIALIPWVCCTVQHTQRFLTVKPEIQDRWLVSTQCMHTGACINLHGKPHPSYFTSPFRFAIDFEAEHHRKWGIRGRFPPKISHCRASLDLCGSIWYCCHVGIHFHRTLSTNGVRSLTKEASYDTTGRALIHPWPAQRLYT